MNYSEFLQSKAISDPATGLEKIPRLNKSLFDFQRDITKWALHRGRAAVWADCGLGKTLMQRSAVTGHKRARISRRPRKSSTDYSLIILDSHVAERLRL